MKTIQLKKKNTHTLSTYENSKTKDINDTIIVMSYFSYCHKLG